MLKRETGELKANDGTVIVRGENELVGKHHTFIHGKAAPGSYTLNYWVQYKNQLPVI